MDTTLGQASLGQVFECQSELVLPNAPIASDGTAETSDDATILFAWPTVFGDGSEDVRGTVRVGRGDAARYFVASAVANDAATVDDDGDDGA